MRSLKSYSENNINYNQTLNEFYFQSREKLIFSLI